VSDYILQYGCIISGTTFVILRALLMVWTGNLLGITRLYFQDRALVSWLSAVTSKIKIGQM
jgi:hypothetical protein